MIPNRKAGPSANLHVSDRNPGSEHEDVPTKAEILEDISEGYSFVMSGGKGQPIDEMHREIAEELAREELAQNADISR